MTFYTSLPRKRRKPRKGQPSKAEVAEIRYAVYQRAKGKCELRLHPECSGDRELPWLGDVWMRFHLAHIGAKRRHGTTVENTRAACWRCHLISLHNPKACPKKER